MTLPASVLTDPSYAVPAPPGGTTGLAWLRRHAVRFSEGADHARRRAMTQRLLDRIRIDPHPGAQPASALAEALGLPGDVVEDVARIAARYQPHLGGSAEADAAVERLLTLCGGRTEETAQVIGLLVQAHAGATALTDVARGERSGPPVPVTRRAAPDGSTVEVDLSEAPFGRGAHACPGRDLGKRLAAAAGAGDAPVGQARAEAFRQLHHGDAPMVLPNAWDVASALALLDAGFEAIGTTSMGVAAAAGAPDAEGHARAETIALATALRNLPSPVSVDLEDGWSEDPDAVADLVAGLHVDARIAGVNLEDGRSNGLAAPVAQARVLAAVATRAPGVFLNARVDTFWRRDLHGDEASLRETMDRALRYIDAGADGIFVPGRLTDAEIETIAASVPAPLNVLASPDRDVTRLTELGVRRVSTGSLLYRRALGAAVDAARAVRDGDALPGAPSYGDVQDVLRSGAGPRRRRRMP